MNGFIVILVFCCFVEMFGGVFKPQRVKLMYLCFVTNIYCMNSLNNSSLPTPPTPQIPE